MKKNIIIALFLLAVILIVILVVISNNKTTSTGNLQSGQVVNKISSENNPDKNIGTENDTNTTLKSSDSGSSSGGSSSSGSGTIENNIPSDIYIQECGFYSSNYGVCAGYCPEGTCTSEGRSCYCKKA